MQTCARCRRSVAAGAAFCPHCGAQLQVQPLQGEIVDGTQRFKKNRPLDPGRAARLSLIPGAMLVLTVLSINVLGDGVRDALDPRSQVRIKS